MTVKRVAACTWLALGGVVVLCLLPRVLDSYALNLLVLVLYNAYLAQAWNIMGGYAGQFSFGHAAFSGLGAYVVALLYVKCGISPWIGMAAGALLATAAGMGIGYLCFRYGLRGPYFVLATLAFAEVLRIIAFNWKAVNGPMGILVPLQPGLRNLQFVGKEPYYYMVLIMLVCLTLLVSRLARSKLGYYLVAIREDEDAAEALGINAMRYKVLAVCLSAFFTALGGAFYTQYFLYIDPQLAFGSELSISIMTPAIVGGAGTVAGPIVGAALLVPLGELIRTGLASYSGLHLLIYGLLLILVVLYLPHGLLSLPSRLRLRPALGKAAPAAGWGMGKGGQE